MGEKIGDKYCYAGVIHVHTTESDGTRSLEDVVAIAQDVGLDFIMFTDHMNLNNRVKGKEGFYGRTLAVVGYEHNDPEDNNHYLIFESPGIYEETAPAAQYVKAAALDNTIGIIAHPDEIRDRMGKYPPYPWTDWSVEGFQGIELWNQMSEWMEQLRPSNTLLMAFSPRKSMVGPTARILKKWDEINQTRKCAGIASVDAHAFPIKIGPMKVEIFPYKVHFRSLRTYILLDETLSDRLDEAKRQLYDAIRECRLYCANVRWGDALAFSFSACNGQESVVSGGRLISHDGAVICVSVPAKGTIRIILDGELVHEFVGRELQYAVTKPGLYRTEVLKHGRGWIFSNHIRIGT